MGKYYTQSNKKIMLAKIVGLVIPNIVITSGIENKLVDLNHYIGKVLNAVRAYHI